ncbi:MAG: hypothetical protein V1644_00955 [Candidatus Micrarchaeota archaeon]
MTTLTPSQMAKMKIGFEKKEQQKPADDSVTMPMFVPTQMKPGDGVLEMTTRQKFVTEGINVWIDWHKYRILAILCAVGAMLLLSIHLWLSAGAGVLAGYFYSEHLRTSARIQLFYKTRRVLYTR